MGVRGVRRAGRLPGGVRVQVAQRQGVGHLRVGEHDGRATAPGLRHSTARPQRQPAVQAGQRRVRRCRPAQPAEALPFQVPDQGVGPVRVPQAQQPRRAGPEPQQYSGGPVGRTRVGARTPGAPAQRQPDHEGAQRCVRPRPAAGPARRVRVPSGTARVHRVRRPRELARVAPA